ncbi:MULTISPECIES: N(4)-(beta-N-acetylglucosaminyl)-L-asparaginase [unclassified Sphingomonas]|jgi:N4-(beta-N-acetylglucosaminyl)-L-asparaginase|uniref:N(4)-(beta-N-acetylglucosaminyl)-L-asparaginase n=1 Tax=unclassified Sphingomonas TaxID=196159 RepID=UPI0004DEF334|nr:MULTISPECIES: N(4)-(beta-N-acetylglucosaminyl)-L-asparaginase [unclassified Sphingomonas]KHA65355.1 N(4)-(beta-N-acetylglucosaminyl)-L-asparaginase [Sphingomonas sp. Ant20]MBD8470969.1 N(4)-(beta-N-acetylglucosaminyl)-L-asparaginase [Sphingomonas sp. CFBP 8765]MDY1006737.1 N(4)-(beta-N-acetylglucosaminyl)-L-asparaginase [Sphingomonas sp. CFBP9019]
MKTRRSLLTAFGGIGAALPFVAPIARARAATGGPAPALIVSTWDFGAAANAAAFARRRAGGSLIDSVEAGAMVPEADPDNHSVGYSGYPDRDGHVTLDAVIMDDAGGVGAVAALENTMHAISVARRVMERTPHTMLVGEGATRFARDQGFKQESLLTPEAEKAWRDWLKTADYRPEANSENRITRTPGGALDHDTIGLLMRDPTGRMAGACTTSGMAFKMRGRVGDSPQVGSGLYVEAGVGGATSTGLGEEVTRVAGSARVVASMRAGASPQQACEEVVRHIARLRGDAIRGVQVGFLALDTKGAVGAFCLLPGFTYAVTDARGSTTVLKARALFAS